MSEDPKGESAVLRDTAVEARKAATEHDSAMASRTGAAQANTSGVQAQQQQKDEDSDDGEDGSIIQRLKRILHLDNELRAGRAPLLDSFDLQGIASYIQSGKAKRIIVMCGAGISVNAGIPDFRSPGTGLYDNLSKYNLPRPEAVFELSYFRKRPKAFYTLAKELFPGAFKPTPTHCFINLLAKKGLLQRCYTQNIDSLERQAGVDPDLIVAAHGNFDGAHCIDCGRERPIDQVKAAVLSGKPCRCSTCNGLVKPDIVFFGEGLPERFFRLTASDFDDCDLLIVLGTSLVVQPFASLVGQVGENTPRALINKEKVTGGGGFSGLLSGRGSSSSFNFGDSNCRDALFLGDCDEGIWQLSRLLGWETELKGLVDDLPVVDWEADVKDSAKAVAAEESSDKKASL
ncbi:hypothetical protein WJX73_001974 [Symbiochloris irregularis]|uniref:Deacetylase sirtuin-type domain-containing protein n=1 Tax=Symbiochloris irregularis TaxID=706552 RepID=A0AAW1PHY9_9CHLO